MPGKATFTLLRPSFQAENGDCWPEYDGGRRKKKGRGDGEQGKILRHRRPKGPVSAAALPKLHRVTVGFGPDGPNVGATPAVALTTPKRTEIKLFHERLTLSLRSLHYRALLRTNGAGNSCQLVDELGFDGVDAGSLDESWRQQPGTPVYAKDLDAGGVRRALSEASRERKPEWRATSNSPRSFENPA
jgi:hypothetical protein